MSDVFISCSRHSEKYAEALSDALQGRSISTWLYTRDLGPSQVWSDEILKAMENARVIAFIIEPKLSPSTWQQKEYIAALEYSWSDKNKILLPILIGDADAPPFLRDRVSLRIQNHKSDWAKAAEEVTKVLSETTTPTITKTCEKERVQRLNAIEKGASALRYIDGQRLLVEAMKYLVQSDPVSNRNAIELLSEHVRKRFRMADVDASRSRALRKSKTASKQFR